MQQRFRSYVLFVGVSALAAGGALLSVAACSSDSGTSPVPPTSTNTTLPKDGGGVPEAGPTPTAEGGPGVDAAATADCSKNPVLHDYSDGFRCAFLPTPDGGSGDAGSTENCTNDQTCCETSDKVGSDFQPVFCASAKGGDTICKSEAASHSSSFNAGDAWECADKNACPTGNVCCMIQDPVRLAADPVKNKLNIGNTPASDKNHPPACGVKRSYNEGGSRCKTSCETNLNDVRLCSLSDDGACGAGTTCKPFVDFQNTHRGACLP